MKNFTNYFKTLLLLAAFVGAKTSEAQVNTCSVTLSYTINPSGNMVCIEALTSQTLNANGTYNWGDGSPTTYSANGITCHTYTANGTYTITGGFTNTAFTCTSSVTQTINITGVVPPCIANSSFSSSSPSPGSYAFLSTSTGTSGTSTYQWNFGDGNSATGASVSHVYANDGSYMVTLNVTDATPSTCSDSSFTFISVCTATNVITAVNNANGAVSFMSSAPTGTNVYYQWTFGDGGVLNGPGPGLSNTTHTYSANGVYSVTLSYFAAFGCTVTSQYIVTVSNVVNSCNINTGFTYSQGSGNTVNFTNTSSGTSGGVTYLWNFGDGNTSTSNSPSHTYASTGNYNVTLFANNNFTYMCQDSSYASITVTCIANAAFSLAPSGTPQVWNAYVASPGNIASALWTWGDGTTSNTLFTSHTYPSAGIYSICLTVTTTCGSVGNYCWAYNIFKSADGNQSQEVIQVNVMNASVGIKNTTAESVAFNVAPNPSNGAFRLNLAGLPSGNASVKVYNLVGQEVYSTTVESVKGSFTKDVQLEQVANGVYFVKVNVNGQTATKKIVVANN